MHNTLTRTKRAITLFRHPLANKSQYRYNALAWLASVDKLGNKWLLLTNIEKKN